MGERKCSMAGKCVNGLAASTYGKLLFDSRIDVKVHLQIRAARCYRSHLVSVEHPF